jgi:outer membrane protein assembly factor BamE (lipoprotein component of BamABCDE complex)
MRFHALPVACAGLGLAAAWSCARPAAPVPTVERGRWIDRSILDGFQRGITTRAEVVELLGNPSSTVTNAGDGSTTCSWDYYHSDAKGTFAIMTILTFSSDDTLQVKMVSQSSHLKP